MLQAIAVLIKQYKPDSPAPQKPPGNKSNFGHVSEVYVYAGFKECKNSTVTSNCTIEMINKLVVAHFNLIEPPKRANDNNIDSVYEYFQTTRRLETTTDFTGYTSVPSSGGADLIKSVGGPTFGSSIDVTPLQDGGKSSYGRLTMAAVVVILSMATL